MRFEIFPWIIIAALLGYIMFLQQCRGQEVVIKEGKTMVHTDTIFVTETDTVYRTLPADTVRLVVREPVEVSDSLRTYRDTFGDRMLTGEVWVRTSGFLDDWGLTYLLREREIRTLDREIEIRTVTVPQYLRREDTAPRLQLLAGAGLSGHREAQSFAVMAGFGRGRYQYQYRYDPLRGEHGVSVVRVFGW